MTSRARLRLVKLALLATTLFVCLGLLELGVRLFWVSPVHSVDDRAHQGDPWPCVWRFKPRYRVHIPVADTAGEDVPLNDRGFRGPDPATLGAHRVRVASIGDSFTFGWGVHFEDQCFVAFVNDYAAAHPDADVAHASFAEPGWGPRDYFFAYVAEARRYRPDLVILGFFCGDDLVSPGMVASIGEGRPPPRQWRRERKWYHLETLEWVRFHVRSSPTLTRLFLQAGLRPRSDLQRFLRNEPPPLPTMWDETFTFLLALDSAVRHDGGRLVIAAFPSLIQVFGHDGLNDRLFDYEHIEKRLSEFCARCDIPFVPFLPALMADGQLDLYYPIDRHLTRRGHEVCRRELTRRLEPLLDEIARRKSRRP